MSSKTPNRIRFTEAVIARLEPPAEGEIIWWDSTTPTLGLRVSKTGRKTWTRGKRKLGVWPAMSLKEARALMADEPTEPAKVPAVFSELVAQFLEHGRTRLGRPLRPTTRDQYRRILNGHAVTLHKLPIREITRADIARLTRKVATENGAPMASLLRAVLGRLWAFAIEIGEADYSVVAGSPGYLVAKRSRVLSDGELAALWSATDTLEPFHVIVRLLLLTGCRANEIGKLRWHEIEHDGVLRIPGERIKTHRELVLPLPRLALDELARVPRIVGEPHVFGPRGFNSWFRAKRRLDKRLQFAKPWMVHDLRRTTESRLAQIGVTKEIRSRLLNHDVGDIDLAYQHYDFKAEKAEALARWAAELERIVEQRPAVVAMNQKGA
jgi:integrase